METHKLGSYDLGDLFESIRITELTHLYLETLLHYAHHTVWDFDLFEQHSCAIEALGAHVYRTKDKNTYSFLYQQAQASVRQALINSNDQENKDDHLFRAACYIKAIFFSLEGRKSYTRPRLKFLDLNFILNKIPNKLPI